jgi:peptide deformylase
MIRDIYEYPSAVLERVMPEVKVFGPKVAATCNDLRETMLNSKGVGLAANQIGVELRICITRVKDTDRCFEFLNPVILKRQGKLWSPESCLSIPDYSAIIPRSEEVRIGYRTRENKPALMTLAGEAAIRVQHEIDHLDGILIHDYVEGKKGKKGGINATIGTLEETK